MNKADYIINKLVLVFLVLVLFSITSCKNKESNVSLEIKNTISEKKSKPINEILDSIFSLSQSIEKLDLSQKEMKAMPDLSSYKIKKLNLSNNAIDSFILSRLPSKLEYLNISNNKLKSISIKDCKSNIDSIDISYNNLRYVYIRCGGDKFLNASNNDIKEIHLFPKEVMGSLNVSNNPNLDNELSFSPKAYDSIVSHNIGSEKPLTHKKRVKEIIVD